MSFFHHVISDVIFRVHPRLKINDTLKLILPSGHPFAQLNSTLHITNGDGSIEEIPFERTPLGGGLCQWRPRCSGPAELKMRCQTLSTPTETQWSDTSRVIVGPCLMFNESELPASALCISTTIAQRLGHVSRWKDVLKFVSKQNFNAIHLTPVQVLGESQSSYSVADYHRVSPAIASSWEELAATVDSVYKDLKMMSFADLVLNHTANNNAWLKDHPEAGYNVKNSPWLLGAIELDLAIRKFNSEVYEGRWESKYGARRDIRNDNDLGCLLRAFREECLNHFNLREFFYVDINQCCSQLGKVNFAGPRSKVDEIAWEETLKMVGTTRKGIVLSPEVVAQLARSEADLRRVLQSVNDRLMMKSGEIYKAIVDSLEGGVRYERLECRKGPIDCTPWNSLVPWYFTPVNCNNGETLHLANNGWVMGWDVSKDFAGPGTLVYLSRSLVAWSDCVKLRYGQQPSDSPALWEMMGSYCEQTAKIFHGVRLDNCHSTPLAVGKYMLTRARKARSNLFVFAELFTGKAEMDLVFERELGLDALVREAVQVSSPGDLAWHTMKFSSEHLGHLKPQECPLNYHVGNSEPLSEGKAISLFYDCTHDNETPFQKGRMEDTLACAAMVCASPYSVGSTFGYEVMVKKNPSVLADEQLYPIYFDGDQTPSNERNLDRPQQIIWRGNCSNSVQVWGSFNNWSCGITMLRAGPSKYTMDIIPEWTAQKEFAFKYVVDGNWCCGSDYPTERDASGNENHIWRESGVVQTYGAQSGFTLGRGIADARSVLNSVHTKMAKEGFDEISVQWVCSDFHVIERHNRKTSESIYFFIRSHWWKNGCVTPEVKHVQVMGKIVAKILSSSVCIRRPKWDDGSKFVQGVAEEMSCVDKMVDPHNWYDNSTDMTHMTFDYLPPGAVYVCLCQSRRPDARLIKHMENLNLEMLSLISVNKLLWSCEREEQDRSKGRRGVYQFPNMENIVYAGFAGTCQAIKLARLSDEKDHPFCVNVREGNWLLDYHLARVVEDSATLPHEFVSWFREGIEMIKSCPHVQLKPKSIDYFFTTLFQRIVDHSLKVMNMLNEDILMQQLAMTTTQLLGIVPSSSLSDTRQTATMSAGLPHFSTEYMREWGRDTFIALPGMCIATSRWEEAELEILSFCRVLRHAMIPNLLDSSNNPRYNARDAVWFWLFGIMSYVKHAPNGESILSHFVSLKFPQSLEYETPSVSTVMDAIHMVLSCHYRGIRFREWNAGLRIDSQMKDPGFNIEVYCDKETGFCLGGNRFNCGTWMDKMGSSEKAGNKGIPATPRDGAPVELTAILWATLNWIVSDLIPRGLWKHLETASLGGQSGIKYSEWLAKVSNHFSAKYLITENDAHRFNKIAVPHTYKDTYGCSVEEEDYYLRCNFPVALAMAEGIVPKAEAVKALEVCYSRLMNEPNQVGMKTLDPYHYKYRANYDNSNDGYDRDVAHGWNYHNGPEWVWPYGYWLTARYLNGDRSAQDLYECTRRLDKVRRWISQHPWWGLPELMDNNGRVCNDSCQTQAWSSGSILWFMYLASKDAKLRMVEKTSDEEPATRVPGSPL